MKTFLSFLALLSLAAAAAWAQTPPPDSPKISVTTKPPNALQPEGEQNVVFQLRHMQANEMLVMLQPLFPRNAVMSADTGRQRIVVSSTPAVMQKIEELIKQLDTPPPPAGTTADPTRRPPRAATPSDSTLGPPTTPEGHQIEAISLRHISVESGLPIIRQLLPPDARIIGDQEQQRVIVTGSQADIDAVKKTIILLDTPAPQRASTPGPAGRAATAQNQAQTTASAFLRQLQQQAQLPQFPQPAAAASDLARRYQELEQEAQSLAQIWRTLTAKPQGDVQTSAEIATTKTRLQSVVAQAFAARQKQQQEELLEMQRRIYSLAGTIEDREKLKDQIIERRVQDLLNPALQWTPPAAAAAARAGQPPAGATGTPGYSTPRYPTLGAPTGRTAPAADSDSGAIMQIADEMVHVSLGKDAGITSGQALYVYRADECVAELEVIAVQAKHAVTRIKLKTGALRPSDRVSTKAPAPAAVDPKPLPTQSDAGRPLSDAVREFNALNADKPLNRDQPPLTDDEVVAAIRWTTLDRKSLLASDEEIQALLAVADHRVLPPKAQLRMGGETVTPGKGQASKVVIRLELESARGPAYRHVLREQYIGYQGPFRPRDKSEASQLSTAIKAFNQRHLNDPIGKNQPLLSEAEVIAAIVGWASKRDDLPVTNAEFDELQTIAVTGTLPPKAEIEVLTSFQPNDELQFDAWSVRLRLQRGEGGGSYAYTIRNRWLRVKALKERKISWGPAAANGLQVGVWIDPPGSVFAKGQQFVPHFYFRNAGQKDQSISLPRIMTRSYYEGLLVADDSGAAIEYDQDKGPSGPVGWIQMPFAPGAEHEVMGMPIAVGQVKRAPGVETVLCLTSGQQCRLKFLLDNYLDRESKEPLGTGEIRFSLADE